MNSRERFFRRGNLVGYGPDRPPVVRETIIGGIKVDAADQLVVTVTRPLTEPRVVRGHTIGGGTSVEAIWRARRKARRGY